MLEKLCILYNRHKARQKEYITGQVKCKWQEKKK